VVLESPPPVPGSGNLNKGFPCRTVVTVDAVAKDEDEADMVLDAARVFLLGDCPNLKIGLDIWLGGTDSACIFAPIVVPPKTFEVLASLKGFGVPPTAPKTGIDG